MAKTNEQGKVGQIKKHKNHIQILRNMHTENP